jgi:hypothetical protein
VVDIMSLDDFIAELLAWAAFEAWWQRHPVGVALALERTTVDEALVGFIHCLPMPLWMALQSEHWRRRGLS